MNKTFRAGIVALAGLGATPVLAQNESRGGNRSSMIIKNITQAVCHEVAGSIANVLSVVYNRSTKTCTIIHDTHNGNYS